MAYSTQKRDKRGKIPKRKYGTAIHVKKSKKSKLPK